MAALRTRRREERLLRVGENGSVGGRLLTILHTGFHFFPPSLPPRVFGQTSALNSPRQRRSIRHLYLYEMHQLCTRQKMYCLFVVRALSKTPWWSLTVIASIDFVKWWRWLWWGRGWEGVTCLPYPPHIFSLTHSDIKKFFLLFFFFS